MIHALLVLAVVLLVVWVLFHAAGAAINLLLLAALVFAVIWLVGFMRRGTRRTL